jgi:hypothetical protein
MTRPLPAYLLPRSGPCESVDEEHGLRCGLVGEHRVCEFTEPAWLTADDVLVLSSDNSPVDLPECRFCTTSSGIVDEYRRAIERLRPGHTAHCNSGFVHGHGECECGADEWLADAQRVGGYSREGAELLREAMRGKDPDALAKQKGIFVEGAKRLGVMGRYAALAFDSLARRAAQEPACPTASPPSPRDDDASRGGAGSDGIETSRDDQRGTTLSTPPTSASGDASAAPAGVSGSSSDAVEAAARVLWEASEAWFDEFAPEPWDIDAAKPELHPDDIDTATDTRNRYRAIARAVLAHVDRAHVAEVDRATEWWKGACEELQLRLRAAEMAADVRGEALIEWKRDLEWTDDRWQEAEANLRLAMTHGLAECERLRAECARLKADRDAKQAAIAAWITRPTGRDER